jgi:undecaprenyl-diphosphatase
LDTLQTLFLAIVQGVTEFLPISSSAHLILPFEVLGWPDQGLAFDVAVHLGTLLAVIVYFWKDLMSLLQGFFQTLIGKPNQEGRLALNLIAASLPIVVVGLLIKNLVENDLRSAMVITVTTIVFALVLYAADLLGKRRRDTSELTLVHALAIGAAQCLALMPGTSRSGITMTTALALGYHREAASRISFLLSIPTILGASLLLLLDLIAEQNPVEWGDLGLGMLVSGITAYLCIKLFLSFIEKVGFLPFVIYRLALGLGLAVFIL